MINALDLLYLSLAIGFVVFTIFVSFLIYEIILTLRTFRMTLNNIEELSTDINSLKDQLKLGLLTIVSQFFRKFKKHS